jgi:hypothetical protein
MGLWLILDISLLSLRIAKPHGREKSALCC